AEMREGWGTLRYVAACVARNDNEVCGGLQIRRADWFERLTGGRVASVKAAASRRTPKTRPRAQGLRGSGQAGVSVLRVRSCGCWRVVGNREAGSGLPIRRLRQAGACMANANWPGADVHAIKE